jgi:hypothetical protein
VVKCYCPGEAKREERPDDMTKHGGKVAANACFAAQAVGLRDAAAGHEGLDAVDDCRGRRVVGAVQVSDATRIAKARTCCCVRRAG